MCIMYFKTEQINNYYVFKTSEWFLTPEKPIKTKTKWSIAKEVIVIFYCTANTSVFGILATLPVMCEWLKLNYNDYRTKLIEQIKNTNLK